MKRSLGQHFLNDEIIADRIVGAADIKKGDTVIEIGPGAGALTKWIYMSSVTRGILIELDVNLAPKLKDKFPKFEVMNENICGVDIAKLKNRADEKFIVIGNLPYNMSSKILEHLVRYKDVISKMVLMFQKEVGDKICAKAGDSDYSRLSLLALEFYDVEKVLDVEPKYFSPRPDVDSSVLLFNLRKQPIVEIKNREIYNRIVQQMFSNRRKMIRRSLKALYPDDILQKVFAASKIDPQKRPQELTIQEFALLADLIMPKGY
ncbi:MAG: 16S rRNA (adenine(1518)-N(6)/adenine(1519)-N(6))-dimethyltransferase RsmA [Pseudomonadota bacterium]